MKLKLLLITGFIFSQTAFISRAQAADNGQLDCTIYNDKDGTTSTAIITYGGPFIIVPAKDPNLVLRHKQARITVYTSDQRALEDAFAEMRFDEDGTTPRILAGMKAQANLVEGRFDAPKWGYWMSTISCAPSLP